MYIEKLSTEEWLDDICIKWWNVICKAKDYEKFQQRQVHSNIPFITELMNVESNPVLISSVALSQLCHLLLPVFEKKKKLIVKFVYSPEYLLAMS